MYCKKCMYALQFDHTKKINKKEKTEMHLNRGDVAWYFYIPTTTKISTNLSVLAVTDNYSSKPLTNK